MKYLHTMVRVHDLDASMKFYRDALGLVEVKRAEYEAGRFTLVYLAAPGDEDAAVEDDRGLGRRTAQLAQILGGVVEAGIGGDGGRHHRQGQKRRGLHQPSQKLTRCRPLHRDHIPWCKRHAANAQRWIAVFFQVINCRTNFTSTCIVPVLSAI